MDEAKKGDAVETEEEKNVGVEKTPSAPRQTEGDACDCADPEGSDQEPSEEVPAEEQKGVEETEAKQDLPMTEFLPKGSKIYTKQPVQVRAVKMTEAYVVKTDHGNVVGEAGSYLIEDQSGELYPCSSDKFNKIYKSV